jgi:hypothetical protein
LGGERKAILEEVQGILEMVLIRVKLGNTGEEMGWKETSTPPSSRVREGYFRFTNFPRPAERRGVAKRIQNPHRLPCLRRRPENGKQEFKWRTEGRDGCLPTRTTHLLHKAYLRVNGDFAHKQQDDERLLDLFARIKQSLSEFKKEMIVPDEIGGEGERVMRRKINI